MMMGTIGVLELALLAVVTIGACLLAHFVTKRWLWVLGLVACVAAAIVNTPADVVSTLIVSSQVCGLYILSAWAWIAFHRDAAIAK